MYKRFLNSRKIEERKYPRCHYTRKRNSWKPKVPYDTRQEADGFIRKRRLKYYESYLCPVCNKWHIGYSKEEE